jgi:hypothetical protein
MEQIRSSPFGQRVSEALTKLKNVVTNSPSTAASSEAGTRPPIELKDFKKKVLPDETRSGSGSSTVSLQLLFTQEDVQAIARSSFAAGAESRHASLASGVS